MKQRNRCCEYVDVAGNEENEGLDSAFGQIRRTSRAEPNYLVQYKDPPASVGDSGVSQTDHHGFASPQQIRYQDWILIWDLSVERSEWNPPDCVGALQCLLMKSELLESEIESEIAREGSFGLSDY